MKKLIALASVFILAIVLSVFADSPIGLGPTAIGATNSHAIVAHNQVGAPYITFISVSSDVTNKSVNFYQGVVGAVTPLTATVSATTNCPIVTNNFGPETVCVLIKNPTALNPTYQRVTIDLVGPTNCSLKQTITATAGDLLVLMTNAGKIYMNSSAANATNANFSGSPIYVGRAGYPLLIETEGTASPLLNLVGGYFKQ